MTKPITLADLDASQVASLLAEIKANEQKAADEQKALRVKGRELTSIFVQTVVDNLPANTFTSGAVGYSLGGSKITHAGKSYRVSVLIRDEATIPAKEK